MRKSEELETMLRMKLGGATYAEIGRRYGVSYETIRQTLLRHFPEKLEKTNRKERSLTKRQCELIRMHAGLLPRAKIARLVKATEGKVAEYIRRHKLEQTCVHGKYRNDVTDVTRFQICVSDFEGYLPEAIGNLLYLRQERVRQLLREMKETGEYDRFVGVFRQWNEAAYNKAVRRRDGN